ncbi:hypothetical protein PGT21_003060 [Puccinia graminis f. sp. tritici]|uniref:Uncharacterized protein n=1 Tax=Puccinia graminis f. sp. tritici TaxID=56615 RepID=A0A5B0Q547_PUCGR|nr:hypothetical protein PGT21_003060 [Puccinia graminis f. sp. tritici]KAA1136986.1 hypothetical protein PGTUg99_009806 [Puccinia graminis f. sp. tritici]
MAARKANPHVSHYPPIISSNPLSIKALLSLCFTLMFLEGALVAGMEGFATTGFKASSSASRITENSGRANNLAEVGKPGESSVLHNQHGHSVGSPNLNGENGRDLLHRVGSNPTRGQNFDPVSQLRLSVIPKKQKSSSWIKRQWKELQALLKKMFNLDWTRNFFRGIGRAISGKSQQPVGGPHQYSAIPHHQYNQPYVHPGYTFDPGHAVPAGGGNIGGLQQMAPEYLHGIRMRAKLSESAFTMPVKFLPGYMRTNRYIEPDQESFFRAISTIKYGTQDSHALVKDEIFEYVKANPQKFERFLPDDGREYKNKVFEYIYNKTPERRLISGHGLEMMAFAEGNKLNIAFAADTKDYVSTVMYPFGQPNHDHHGIIFINNNYEILRNDIPTRMHPKQA